MFHPENRFWNWRTRGFFWERGHPARENRAHNPVHSFRGQDARAPEALPRLAHKPKTVFRFIYFTRKDHARFAGELARQGILLRENPRAKKSGGGFVF